MKVSTVGKLCEVMLDLKLLFGSLVSDLNDAIEYRRLEILYLFDVLFLQNRIEFL